jgi:hypothetical protein
MTKLILCALALTLAIPAAAAAKAPKPHPRHAAAVMAKNSATMCKALRAQDPVAFRKAFGVNHNGRNAYGKCVAAHARATHLHGVTLTFHNVTISSAGTVTNGGASGCQFTAAGCTVTSAGTLNGILGGTYTSSWTIRWQQATSNGQGGFCAPASGTATLSIPALGTLTKSEQGTVCEVGATGANVEHVLQNGTFSTTGGTGLLSHASGSGTVSFDQKPGATGATGGAVTGAETFSTLTITL